MPLTIRRGGASLTIDKNHPVAGGGGDAEKRHGPLLPSSIRCIICGPSNCGKSMAMLSLLTHPNGLRFENVYVYSRSLHQPKYEYLERVLKPIRGVGYHAFGENDEIVEPSAAKPNSVFIFDDVSCDNQRPMRLYFSMGRHHGVDSFYLCQSYARIPKHLLRDNANMIVLFKQDVLNMKRVFNDHVGTDMSFERFSEICGECWRDDHGFLTVVKDSPLNDGRYRKNFDGFVIIESDPPK